MKRRIVPFLLVTMLLHPALSSGTSLAQSAKSYVCPPCGCTGDDTAHAAPGKCPACGMEMVDRAATLTLQAIPNFHRVSDSVLTGGQPTLAQLDLLKEEGVRTIVNLRMRSEHDAAAESTRARALGMGYVTVPVDFNGPDSADVAAFLRATDTTLGMGKTFVHCAAAIRVGSFWMVRRVVRDGWTEERALEEANAIGIRRITSWIDFARRMIPKFAAGRGQR